MKKCFILITLMLLATQVTAGDYTTDQYGTYGTTEDGRRVNLYHDQFGTYGTVGEDRVNLYRDSYGTYGTVGEERVNIWDNTEREHRDQYDYDKKGRGELGDDDE